MTILNQTTTFLCMYLRDQSVINITVHQQADKAKDID